MKEERIAIAIGAIGTVAGIGSLIALSAVAVSKIFIAIPIILLWGPGTAAVLGGVSSFATYYGWFRILQRRKKLRAKEEGKTEAQSQLGDFIQSLPEAFKSVGCFQQIVTAALGISLIACVVTYTPLKKKINIETEKNVETEEEAVYELETEPETKPEEEGKFVIQITLMNTMPQANRMVKSLERNGVQAYIAKVKNPGETKGTKYRIRVGGFKSVSEAKAYASVNITPLGYSQWYIDNKSNDTIGKPVGYKPPVMWRIEPPPVQQQEVSAPPPRTVRTVALPEDPYAMDSIPKRSVLPIVEPPTPTPRSSGFWNTRNKLRIAALGLSAASLGFGIYQNNQAESKAKYLKEYREAAPLTGGDQYGEAYQKFQEQKNSIDDTKNLRNGFYIGAGTLGVAGVATFFF